MNNVHPEADVQNESGEPYAANIAQDGTSVKNLPLVAGTDEVKEWFRFSTFMSCLSSVSSQSKIGATER